MQPNDHLTVTSLHNPTRHTPPARRPCSRTTTWRSPRCTTPRGPPHHPADARTRPTPPAARRAAERPPDGHLAAQPHAAHPTGPQTMQPNDHLTVTSLHNPARERRHEPARARAQPGAW